MELKLYKSKDKRELHPSNIELLFLRLEKSKIDKSYSFKLLQL